MHALHSFGRRTERRSLPTQLRPRRDSAGGEFNAGGSRRSLKQQNVVTRRASMSQTGQKDREKEVQQTWEAEE